MGRVGLILFTGLALAHVLSFGLVVVERGLAMRGMMLSYLASDVGSSVAMLERLPASEREAWLPRLPAKQARRQVEHRPDQGEERSRGNAQQTERQGQEPDDGKQDQREDGQRPAKRKKDAPADEQEERFHVLFHPSFRPARQWFPHP